MRTFILTLSTLFLISCASGYAQINPTDRLLTINMGASVDVPADLIIFSINVNTQGETPVEAFELHKEQESILADLLNEFEIDEDNISYQPIRIDKRNRNNSESQYSITSQRVSVTFSDFDIYEEIQVALIESNFDNFSGSFSSSELDEGKEEALRTAIIEARKRAEFIAKEAGVTILGVASINNSDHVISPRPGAALESERAFSMSSSSMMDFGQTVSVNANIIIQFEIQSN